MPRGAGVLQLPFAPLGGFSAKTGMLLIYDVVSARDLGFDLWKRAFASRALPRKVSETALTILAGARSQALGHRVLFAPRANGGGKRDDFSPVTDPKILLRSE